MNEQRPILDYRRASKNNSHTGVPDGLMVLLGGVVGLLLSMIVFAWVAVRWGAVVDYDIFRFFKIVPWGLASIGLGCVVGAFLGGMWARRRSRRRAQSIQEQQQADEREDV